MRLIVLFTILVLISLSSPSWAIRVLPISADLDIKKARSHTISVSNKEGTTASPVKITTFLWSINPDGTENNEPTDELLIFPKQFYLEPGQERAIRVAPRYKQPPPVERAYRVVIEELPVKASLKKQSGVKLITKYKTAFYVTPKNAQSDVKLVQAKKNANGFTVELENAGNAHTHLMNLQISLAQGDKTVEIKAPKQLMSFSGENVLAQSKRVFTWAWPEDLAKTINLASPYEVELKWECEFCEMFYQSVSFSPK